MSNTNNPTPPQNNRYVELMQPLVGGRIIEVGVTGEGTDTDEDEYPYLVVQVGKKRLYAVVQVDPEGNGPGFLRVVTEESLAAQQPAAE